MFQRAISLQEWADVAERATILGRVDTGFIMTATGTHPELGALVAIQDPCGSGLILHSENPFRDWMTLPVLTSTVLHGNA